MVLPLLGGISCKLYDDLIDNTIIEKPIILECLKGSQWILLTLISMNDFNFAIAFYCMNLLNAIANADEWNEPYETSLLYIYPVLILLSFHTRQYLHIYDIVLILFNVMVFGIEPLVIKEEVSNRKLVTRVIILYCLLFVIVLGSYFSLSTSIIKIFYYSLGYTITSSIFQAYSLGYIPGVSPRA